MTNNLDSLEIKLFRFNHSMDYLPYYRTYKIKYTQDECVYDILNKINEIETFSYETKDECIININNYFLSSDILLKDIVGVVGKKLTIEPVSLYRVTNDLIIDSEDYDKKIEIFEEFLTVEQKKSFKNKYKLEYYGSRSIMINKDYIGDHCLLIANELISQHKEAEEKILSLITNKDTGILYHTSLEKRILQDRYDLESVYASLIRKISKYKNISIDKKKESILPEHFEIVQYFKGFNIALYNPQGCIYKKLIEQSRATYIELERRYDDLALSSQLVNKEFSLNIAGEILLEAKDKNVDFLIVQDEEQLDIFDGKQKKIEAVVNREIRLPVITQKQFVLLLEGEKNSKILGVDSHTIDVSFLE